MPQFFYGMVVIGLLSMVGDVVDVGRALGGCWKGFRRALGRRWEGVVIS